MTKEEKAVVINNLAEQLNEYPHFYLTDIETLNAEQTAQLRRKCFENEIKLVVVKNTLFGKALEKAEKAVADLMKVLEGSTSVMFATTAKAPAVVIKEFHIKSKEELIGEIVSLLQSPAKNVISALQANAGQKIAGLVKTLEERN